MTRAYSFGRYFESSGRQDVLMSGYLGSMQIALPAAMGALAAYGMPITLVVLDNGELGNVSKEQRAGDWQVWKTSLPNPDFARFADLCGIRGSRWPRRLSWSWP